MNNNSFKIKLKKFFIIIVIAVIVIAVFALTFGVRTIISKGNYQSVYREEVDEVLLAPYINSQAVITYEENGYTVYFDYEELTNYLREKIIKLETAYFKTPFKTSELSGKDIIRDYIALSDMMLIQKQRGEKEVSLNALMGVVDRESYFYNRRFASFNLVLDLVFFAIRDESIETKITDRGGQGVGEVYYKYTSEASSDQYFEGRCTGPSHLITLKFYTKQAQLFEGSVSLGDQFVRRTCWNF